MFRFFLAFFSFFTFINSAFSNEYRHKSVRKAGQDYYYIGIGIAIPVSNKVTDASTFKLKPSGEIATAMEESNIPVDSYSKGAHTFPSQKISANAFLGYKTTSFLRFDAKIDFFTFTRTFQVLRTTIFTTTETDINFTVRQIGLIASTYFDLDNSSSFTPYIGAGAGGALTQAVFAMDVGGTSYQDINGSLLGKPSFVYELKSGLKVGSRKAYIDFELFHRNLPGLTLTSVGFGVKAGFRI